MFKKHNALDIPLRINTHNIKYMSHINNVQSFEKLLGICTGYGGTYNPGQQNLRVENLSVILMRAREKLLQVSVAKTNYEHAQNSREAAFEEIRKLAPRILAELKSADVLPETVHDAALMVRKMMGYTSLVKPSGAVEAPSGSGISNPGPVRKRSSGSDFGNTMANFEKLIQTLASVPLYQPSNEELQVDILQANLATLQILNTAVVTAASALGKARRERNTVLYLGRSSLCSTALTVKQKVKATFGTSSEAFKAARKIRFTKMNIR
jgi:hypothetical protein